MTTPQINFPLTRDKGRTLSDVSTGVVYVCAEYLTHGHIRLISLWSPQLALFLSSPVAHCVNPFRCVEPTCPFRDPCRAAPVVELRGVSSC